MDDFGTLARDFGFRPQGKSAPMAPPKANLGGGSDGVGRAARSSSSSSSFDQSRDGFLFNDVFGGPPKSTSTNNSKSAASMSDFDYDSIFKSSSTSAKDSKVRSSSPVYDKPVYDEDIFDGLPGLKSKSMSSKVSYDNDVFESISSPLTRNQNQSSSVVDDFLENLGRSEKSEPKNYKSSRGLDDLIPGFGDTSPPISSRPLSESSQPERTNLGSPKPTANMMEDPFVVLESTSAPAASSTGLFTDPLEEISKLGNTGNTKHSGSSVSGGVFDDIDPLGGFGTSVPAFSSEINNRVREGSPGRSRTGSSMGKAQTYSTTGPFVSSSFRDSENNSQKTMSSDNFQESHETIFDMPNVTTDSRKPVRQTAYQSYVNTSSSEINSPGDESPESEGQVEPSDDVWLTVSEIPLFTQPTSAPPPSRRPPSLPARASQSEAGLFTSNARKKGNEFSSSSFRQYSQSPKPTRPPVKSTVVSQTDELEDFAMGRTRNSVDEYSEIHSGEVDTNSSAAESAAAMKEAMDRAEAKFRHAKEAREREYTKTARSKESGQLDKEERAMQDDQEREYTENPERLDRERRQREEEEREQRRHEKERERAREIEREREKGRQAVERATREARERAAVEARERAAAEARLKSERAAVGKAHAEARERAERAAVQRAQAEARERAAAEARERAEKAAAEARERANAEAREKEAREKAAATRAEVEARRRTERAAVERAAAEARERAAAAARMNQQKNDNDLESFFSMGSRPSSAPRPRANTSDPVLDPQYQSKGRTEGARTSVSSSNMRKASSTANIVDDLTSIFGAAPSSGEFQEVEGETEERRRARLERHQRTQERAARALAEKNQRDLQTQRDQEERHRIAETLDVEIKRWSAGKEGNLRALLSTLQYVLWAECGWQPVSLTDLITGASVKKVYRKATLCIHPDKVQQKGATLQQKYVAEKVFDLLKEAWNKFNSEELF